MLTKVLEEDTSAQLMLLRHMGPLVLEERGLLVRRGGHADLPVLWLEQQSLHKANHPHRHNKYESLNVYMKLYSMHAQGRCNLILVVVSSAITCCTHSFRICFQTDWIGIVYLIQVPLHSIEYKSHTFEHKDLSLHYTICWHTMFYVWGDMIDVSAASKSISWKTMVLASIS